MFVPNTNTTSTLYTHTQPQFSRYLYGACLCVYCMCYHRCRSCCSPFWDVLCVSISVWLFHFTQFLVSLCNWIDSPILVHMHSTIRTATIFNQINPNRHWFVRFIFNANEGILIGAFRKSFDIYRIFFAKINLKNGQFLNGIFFKSIFKWHSCSISWLKRNRVQPFRIAPGFLVANPSYRLHLTYAN